MINLSKIFLNNLSFMIFVALGFHLGSVSLFAKKVTPDEIEFISQAIPEGIPANKKYRVLVFSTL